jgi:hypothetical protein
MAKWGRNDQAVTANSTTTKETSNGAPIGTFALVKAGGGANAHFGNTSAGSRAATDVNMFGNTTPGAFIPGVAVGVFGVDAYDGNAEMSISNGGIATAVVINSGSGYGANAAITLTATNGGQEGSANAYANNTTLAGKITQIKISSVGDGYITPPTVTIDPPAVINITANSTSFANSTVSGAGNSAFIIASANSRWQVGDRLYYTVPTSNSSIAPLTGNSYYYISFANTTVVKLASTIGGSNIAITDTRVTGAAEVHTFRGDTATGAATVAGAKNNGIAHAGWVLRTEGTGGRAGRVQYETLVAMGSLGQIYGKYGTAADITDASDDAVLPEPSNRVN